MNFKKYDVEDILDGVAREYVSKAPDSLELGSYDAMTPLQKYQIKGNLLPLLTLFMPFMEKAVVEASAKSIEAAGTMGVSASDALSLFLEA